MPESIAAANRRGQGARRSPTVAQLRAFVAIGRLRHFGDAADALGVSQPTLSQSLATLESNLGVQLIERHPRMILVTPAGRRLLPLAEEAVAAVDAVADSAEPSDWRVGHLSMGIIPTVAPYLLPGVLKELREEAPDLLLTVREDQTARLAEALRRGEIDVALLALPLGLAATVEIPLYEEDFVLAVPPRHPLAGTRDQDPAVLGDVKLLLLDEGHCLRDQALAVCEEHSIGGVGHDPARASSLATIVQLVAAGMGATLLPATAVPTESGDTRLGIAGFAQPAPSRTVGLVHRDTTWRAEEYGLLANILRTAVIASDLPVTLLDS